MQSLHRHALESIFGFLTLTELSRMLIASRIFTPPIVSMRAIDGATTRPFTPSATSLLLRHVGRVSGRGDYAAVDLPASAVHSLALLLNLRVLDMKLSSDWSAMPELPPRLTELRVEICECAVAPNLVILAAVALSQLTQFSLRARPKPDVTLDYRPLRALAALRDLELNCGDEFSLQQLDQIRAMTQLRSVDLHCSNRSLAQLLRAPHELRWTRVASYVGVYPRDCAMLTNIPSLEWLTCGAMCKVDFLFSLPALRYLDLRLYGCLSEPSELAAALQSLTQLTVLSISGAKLNDDELAATLAALPLLESLSLSDLPRLWTLVPLTVGSVPRNLKSLWLQSFERSSADYLPHLLQLQSLTHLSLCGSFTDAVDDAAMAPFRAPSALLPNLQSSSIYIEPPRVEAAEEHD